MNQTRTKLGAVCLALAALAGCGQSHTDTSTDSSVSPWLYGLMGYSLGVLTARHTAPQPPAPQVVVSRPVVVANAAATAAQQAHQRPAEPPAKVAPPPTPTPAPVPKSPPAPAVAPARPTYSGPTGYSNIRQSAPTYSGGARR